MRILEPKVQRKNRPLMGSGFLFLKPGGGLFPDACLFPASCFPI